jgi:hypothetical protein
LPCCISVVSFFPIYRLSPGGAHELPAIGRKQARCHGGNNASAR